MRYCYTDKNKFVFLEGDVGSFFFIISEGQTQVIKSQTVIKTLRKGDAFGELALLYGAPRSAAIYCPVKTSFWILESRKFQDVLRMIKANQFTMTRKVLSNVRFFGRLCLTLRFLLCFSKECPGNGHGD